MMENEEQEMGQDSLAPPSEEGYTITILITPTGFSVTKEGSEPVEARDSTSMLKAVLSIVQSNPSVDQSVDDMAQGFHSA